ncbi:SCO family protein [Prosthecomicrobium sp. N25]|uniref:SCO family protein n=1 Tax=Prosthecomicrobium sp. N25 TaxID=3129254 RepID=UPI003077E349
MRLIGTIAAAALAGLVTAAPVPGRAAGPAASDPVASPSRSIDPESALAKSRAAVGHELGPHRLTDMYGRSFDLGELRGRPLVVSLVYTSCSSVCPLATQQLIRVVGEAQAVLGRDRFTVLTVGFDARQDTPGRLAQFAARQGALLPNWRFASADAETLAKLLDDLGFTYAAVAGGFDHVSQVSIVDPAGRIHRQVYGDDYPTQMFMEPLKDVVFGSAAPLSVAGLVDRVRFLCTTFDPALGRYRTRTEVMVAGMALGALSLVGFGLVVLREWRRARPAPARSQGRKTA